MTPVLYGFQGRLARLPFLGLLLLTWLLSTIVGLVGAYFFVLNLATGAVVLVGLAVVSLVLSELALTARRLHDLDMSAHHLWWISLARLAVAAVNGVEAAVRQGVEIGLPEERFVVYVIQVVVNLFYAAVVLALLLTRGTADANRFGPPPD